VQLLISYRHVAFSKIVGLQLDARLIAEKFVWLEKKCLYFNLSFAGKIAVLCDRNLFSTCTFFFVLVSVLYFRIDYSLILLLCLINVYGFYCGRAY
jgi:hypothetical protein